MADSVASESHRPEPAAPLPSQRGIDVIINSRSGASDKDAVAGRVSEYLASRGLTGRVTVVRTSGELAAAIARAAAGDAGVVVAGGGDGTIATVATALRGSRKILGVLPLGTFNYFARRIGVPLDVDAALEVLAAGATSQVSVGEVNERVFLNNASIGLYPALLRQRETTYRQIGRSRVASYLSAALVLARRPAFLSLQMKLDGHPSSRRTPLMFIGTNALQMAAFAIPGDACLQSGQLAVCIARPLGVARLWLIAVRAFLRGLYGAREIEVICAREIEVRMRWPRRIPVAMDGEVVVLETPLRFRLKVDSLTVISGPGAGDTDPETP